MRDHPAPEPIPPHPDTSRPTDCSGVTTRDEPLTAPGDVGTPSRAVDAPQRPDERLQVDADPVTVNVEIIVTGALRAGAGRRKDERESVRYKVERFHGVF